MKILGIETSCDETAAAIVEDGRKILSNVVVSQIDIHATYGGVVPEIAARSHIEAIQPVLKKAFADADLAAQHLDAIAVTHTPGLVGSLLVGTLAARTLAILYNKPLYPIHHLKSHIYANWLNAHSDSSNSLPNFPLIAAVISGGHTQLIYMKHHNHFQIIGTTRDDAIGECFDKVAKILGLSYPGGPSIAHAAENATYPTKYSLPIPNVPELDFSFSGLKTAVLRTVQHELHLPISTPSYELKDHLNPNQVNNFAAAFQNTAIKILIKKLQKATEQYPAKSIILAGGVSANTALRHAVQETFQKTHQVLFPAPEFCTDNGAMVAASAYFSINSQNPPKPQDPYTLDISPRSTIY
ncbi:tRNA (adenosine(37)-N6)-threonylcarbamoyltransferase complex transferase subunit TsaD [Candidatus Saccharibacteria bacterium]|nr:tRNA (adenosine(37)-N6)-threonylcarbamoyltransferase complex transferase subunit TsaD [Candidatus Saccharibacteria bacterium]